MISIPKYELDWSNGRVFGKDLINQVEIDDEGFIIEKYRLYDDLVSGVTKFDSEDEKLQAMSELLVDDTIYAYASLRWNGKPIRMKYYQDVVMNDNHRRIDVEAANQQGKSFTLQTKASCKFLQDHGKNTHIGLVSKSMAQNSMNMRAVRKMLKSGDFRYTPGGNDNMTVMIHDFKDNAGNVLYSNTLVCAVATTGALGFPFDWLFLDEFEFWEMPEGLEYMYDQVLDPRTFDTRGQIIIYSNPNGKNFVSENLHKRTITIGFVEGKETVESLKEKYPKIRYIKTEKGRDLFDTGEYQFHIYNVDFLDNPSNSQEEWETKKSYSHPIIFASTMAALRTESEGSALTEKDVQSTKDDELTEKNMHLAADKESFWFLDLGFVHDQCALIAGWKEWSSIKDAEGNLVADKTKPCKFKFAVHVYPQGYEIPSLWNKDEYDSVPSHIRRFGSNMQQFEMDITGKEGNEVLANNAGIGCSGVKMSGPWKATHYERFITLTKLGRIATSWAENYIDGHNKNFPYQARSLRISTKMSNGNTRPYPLYHHTNEKDHDDILDAVVGCLSLMDDDMNPEAGGFFVSGEKDLAREQNVIDKEKQRKMMEDNPEIAGFDDEEGTINDLYLESKIYGGYQEW